VLSVRLERWTARPPEPPGWEDADELPWQTLPGEPDVQVSGFDPTDCALPLGDLRTGRVRVLARGRHRYYGDYGEFRPSLSPEEWLVQWWPEAGDLDALAGGPRRLGVPWRHEQQAWRSSGWFYLLSEFSGLYQLLDVMGRHPAGFSQEIITADWARTAFTGLAPYLWDDPATRTPQPWETPHGVQEREWIRGYAHHRGVAPPQTLADLWVLMIDLGMVAPTESGLFVASAGVRAVFDEPGLPAELLEKIRASQRVTPQSPGVSYVVGDIRHLLGWASEGTLAITPARIAHRLDVDVALVLAALASEEFAGRGTIESDTDTIAADTVVTVRPRRYG
jgi:hypothetical protein